MPIRRFPADAAPCGTDHAELRTSAPAEQEIVAMAPSRDTVRTTKRADIDRQRLDQLAGQVRSAKLFNFLNDLAVAIAEKTRAGQFHPTHRAWVVANNGERGQPV